ncbi:MAG TPA: thymidylate kinase [Candidatus Saccharimonadia bacterium]
MTRFCALVGADGAGKSYLADQIARHLTDTGRSDVVVAAKDQPFDGGSLAAARLLGMHRLTWSYPNDEEVWAYPREYWLYQIMAWFTLFYEQEVQPALERGAIVVTDGWHFKHHARFRLAPDPNLVALADQLFARLFQPDLVLLLDTPANIAAARKAGTSKPSEHGAFDTGSGTLDPADMAAFHHAQSTALNGVLANHPATLLRMEHTITPAEALALITEARRSR